MKENLAMHRQKEISFRNFSFICPGHWEGPLLIFVAACCFILTSFIAAAKPVAEKNNPYWVMLGANNTMIVRAVAQKLPCPKLIVDKKVQRMLPRTQASQSFPMTVCETSLPLSTTHSVLLNGVPLNLPKAMPKKIAIIGDTGCRIKHGEVQACDDPNAWPFAAIAQSIANWEPDLVIHVGDYLYRETPCPKGNKGCFGSPYGDRWETWQADFFFPAAPLLKAAPWIFVRGNHESCHRAGVGWFTLLDPNAMPEQCLDYTQPYQVLLGDERLMIFDSSYANDKHADQKQVKEYVRQLGFLNTIENHTGWLITHKPIWAVDKVLRNDTIKFINHTLQDVFSKAHLNTVKFVLSGHIHLFQVFNFTDKKIPQVIVGNSGSELLNHQMPKKWSNVTIGNRTIANGCSEKIYGFLALEHQKNGWLATLRNREGVVRQHCQHDSFTITQTPSGQE